MKTLIATTAIALSLAAPSFAATSDAAALFAAGNDSAAERVLRETSRGDTRAAQVIGAAGNESAAEIRVTGEAGIASRNEAALQQFALDNDSASERGINR